MFDANTAPEGSVLVTTGYAVSPSTDTIHNGKSYTIVTVYEFVGGKWEGFVAMREVK